MTAQANVDTARLADKVARARLFGFLWPFGGAHFAARAPIRGVLLAALGVTGLLLGASQSMGLFALWPFAVAVDILSVRGALLDREASLARSEAKRLPE